MSRNNWNRIRCYCCGRPGPDTRVDGGAMHFRCWDEHHSDPTTEWPIGHECKGRPDNPSHVFTLNHEEAPSNGS